MSGGTEQNDDQFSRICHTNGTNYVLPHAEKTGNHCANFLDLGFHMQAIQQIKIVLGLYAGGTSLKAQSDFPLSSVAIHEFRVYSFLSNTSLCKP
jgi:hypothetical protein